MSALPKSLVLVGAGKMGGAMLEGWLALGMDPAAITALDPYPSTDLQAAATATGFRLNPPEGSVSSPEVLVLAIKPQTLEAAGPSIAPLVGPRTLVVSIMAGKTMGDIAARLPASAIARAMPTRCGRNQVPPVSGIRPILENAVVNLASSAAMRMSHAKASDSPAPAAAPGTTASVGLGILNSLPAVACPLAGTFQECPKSDRGTKAYPGHWQSSSCSAGS